MYTSLNVEAVEHFSLDEPLEFRPTGINLITPT